MSTDALREALQNIISAYDEWANNPDLDFGSARLDDAIDRAKAVLATPACETEKLRAALERLVEACLLAEEHEELSDYIDGSLIDEARAALKADRQGQTK